MTELPVMTSWVDNADLETAKKILAAVAKWEVRPSCAEEFRNYKKILRYQHLLEGEKPEDWLPDVRAFLHQLVSDYQNRFIPIHRGLK